MADRNDQILVHRQQDSANIEPSKSNTLAVYDKQQGVKVRKQGFFGNLGRKTTLSGVQLAELLLELIASTR